MESRIKTKLKEIEKLVKDVLFDSQTGKLTTSYNEGTDAVADLQAFIDAQGFLTSGLQVSDIIDNLTTSAANKALSAGQGVVLKTFIDNILSILNSPDTSLDDLQEIVAYIKQNKQDLQDLSIENIATGTIPHGYLLLNDAGTWVGFDIVAALAGKANTNDPRFHSHANKAILDAITQAKINQWDANAGGTKNIRVDGNTTVNITAADDVVIAGDTAYKTVNIPAPGDVPTGKELWIVCHTSGATLNRQLIDSKVGNPGTTLNAGAVHLKSDGTSWYQTNEHPLPVYMTTNGGEEIPPYTDVVRYEGSAEGEIPLPAASFPELKKIKIIFEKSAGFGMYKNTFGQEIDSSKTLPAAGSVFELINVGGAWEKIN